MPDGEHFGNTLSPFLVAVLCVHTNLLPFGQCCIYLLRLISVANYYCKGVLDKSIIHNNTLMTEGSEGLFYDGGSQFNFMCTKMRIQNKTLITLIIVTY